MQTNQIIIAWIASPDYQTIAYNQLINMRNSYLLELQRQLVINKNLLQIELATQSNQQTICWSPVTKGAEKSLQSQSESEIQYKELNNLKSSKKISHNSSLRNDTKNIPKNYGKAILTFIQKSPLSKQLANSMGIKFSDFMMQIRRIKKKINSIQGLKKMWGSQNLGNQVKKCIRILSYQFMRKQCLYYIFHSKVRNFGTHIKYRQKLIEGIQNPIAFNHIKDF